jgi:hypothetical protein
MLHHLKSVAFATSIICASLLVSTFAPTLALAQQSKAAATASPKAGPGEKVCRHTHPTGVKKAWVCKKEEPCCAWDEINYVKCGSVTFKCL